MDLIRKLGFGTFGTINGAIEGGVASFFTPTYLRWTRGAIQEQERRQQEEREIRQILEQGRRQQEERRQQEVSVQRSREIEAAEERLRQAPTEEVGDNQYIVLRDKIEKDKRIEEDRQVALRLHAELNG